MEQNLVSVCIITYNSSKTIVETLDSIFSQTYSNLELIISDDCSKDDTVEICNEWIRNNGQRFIRCLVISSKKNTGTTANCNRAFKAAKGSWIKLIAGDDLMIPDAVDVFLNYCQTNKKQVCVSRLEYFGDENRIRQKIASYEPFYERYKNLDRNGQYKLLLKSCALPAPSLFISQKVLEEINYLDESYSFYEEWPTYLKCIIAGYDIPYISDRLVKYRCEQSCLSAAATYDETIKGKSYKVARTKVTDDECKFYYNFRRSRLLQNHCYYTVWCLDIKYRLYNIYTKPTLSVADRIQILLLKVLRPITYKYAWHHIKSMIKK